MKEKATCIMCGKCCYHWNDKGQLRPCRKLVRGKNHTYCKVYKKRLGRRIRTYRGYRINCIMRSESKFDYPGCPLNTGKPMATYKNVKKYLDKNFKKNGAEKK